MEMEHRYAYYPGCSLETTSEEYNRSLMEVCGALGVELVEIPDWTCCGASSAHMTDYRLAHALAAENLALAEKMGLGIVTACPACFQRLKSAQREAGDNPELGEKLRQQTGWTGEGKHKIRHILDVIHHDVGTKAIKERVVKPLEGLKVACYYGCYLVRPPELNGFDDPENPQLMDRVVEAAGTEALDWDGKVYCCGGSLSLSEKELTLELVSDILDAAQAVGAEAVVTACPLCQINLETRQPGQSPLPVFYFTELLGLAMGLPAGSWLKKHLINPSRLLKAHRLSA